MGQAWPRPRILFRITYISYSNRMIKLCKTMFFHTNDTEIYTKLTM